MKTGRSPLAGRQRLGGGILLTLLTTLVLGEEGISLRSAAEESLRSTLEQEPDFALAWNALGAVVRSRGDATSALGIIQKALDLDPEYVAAQRNLERTRLHVEVFERLLALLTALPAQWEHLADAEARVADRFHREPPSEDELHEALVLLSSVVLALPEDRDEILAQWLARSPLSQASLVAVERGS